MTVENSRHRNRPPGRVFPGHAKTQHEQLLAARAMDGPEHGQSGSRRFANAGKTLIDRRPGSPQYVTAAVAYGCVQPGIDAGESGFRQRGWQDQAASGIEIRGSKQAEYLSLERALHSAHGAAFKRAVQRQPGQAEE